MKAKDKGGEKHQKRVAQKSIKEKRAAKRAKKQGTTTVHITTTPQQ
ncbi:MAG TPA: hypothetical protein VGA93_02805 [Actinomycetota bacterium]